MYSPRSAGRFALAAIPLALVLLSGLALFEGTPSAQAQTETTSSTSSTCSTSPASGTNATVAAAQTGYVGTPPPSTVPVTMQGGILVYAVSTPYNATTGQEGTWAGEPVTQSC